VAILLGRNPFALIGVNKMIRCSFLVLLLAASTWSNLFAADSLSVGELSLRDAIAATLNNYPQFRVFELRRQALEGERQTADLKPAMTISTEVENIIGTGDLNWFQGTELTLALSQVVELGDKRSARTNVVSQRQNLLMAEQRVLELELLSETTRRFIELAGVEQQVTLLSRATELAQGIFDSVSERVAAGRAPDAELSRASAALRLAQLAEVSAGFSIEAAKVRLSSLWGDLEPAFNGVSANLLEVGEPASIQSLLDSIESNPAIQIYASEERLRDAELREANTRRRANIQLGAGLKHLEELNDSGFLVQFSMPLNSKNRARGAITTAQANLFAVEPERELAKLRMSAQLIALDQERRLSLNQVAILRDGVLPQLTDALNQTQEAFDSGRYSYLELSAAQRELLDAEFELIDAATRAHLLRVEIERLSGEELAAPTLRNSQ